MGLKAKPSSVPSRPAPRAVPSRTPSRQASAGKTRAARRRADNDTVDAYVGRLGGEQRAVAERLRALVRAAAPEAVESIKWAQPVYETEGPFAYLRAEDDRVTLGFWRGSELDDPRGVLQGDGERMRHLDFRTAADIDDGLIEDLARQAAAKNRELGNPTRPTVARVEAPAAPTTVSSATVDAGWTFDDGETTPRGRAAAPTDDAVVDAELADDDGELVAGQRDEEDEDDDHDADDAGADDDGALAGDRDDD